MKMILTAWHVRSAATITLLALAVVAPTAHADYLVRTSADNAPAPIRSPLGKENVLPQLVSSESLTVYGPHEDSTDPSVSEIDRESLATAVQALLHCAIPPPVTTIVQTPTNSAPEQPGVPAPPQYIVPTYPVGSGSGSGLSHTEDLPEPASLVTALLGTGITGLVMWRRKGKSRRRKALAV